MSSAPDPVLFSRAVDVVREGPGRYRAELAHAWEAGGGKQHGGVLLAVATRAALAALEEHRAAGPGAPRPPASGRRIPSAPAAHGAECAAAQQGVRQPHMPQPHMPQPHMPQLHMPQLHMPQPHMPQLHMPRQPPTLPLAVNASYVRAAATGPAEVGTEVLGDDGSAAVVRSVLRQGGEVMLDVTVTAGGLAGPADPVPGELTPLPEEPPADLRGPIEGSPKDPPLASACDVRIDPATTAYRRRERAEPVMRGWVRAKGEPPDPLFALFAGDILPTGLFNFGLLGWAPTVQLTALLRAAPAPGWLRVATATRGIAGGWFDEDVTVVDSTGQLVCRARQLARAPRPRD